MVVHPEVQIISEGLMSRFETVTAAGDDGNPLER
jgi:hypothetical protein